MIAIVSPTARAGRGDRGQALVEVAAARIDPDLHGAEALLAQAEGGLGARGRR